MSLLARFWPRTSVRVLLGLSILIFLLGNVNATIWSGTLGRVRHQVQPVEGAESGPPSPLLPATLIQVIDTSKAAWNPSSPDPVGIAYRPSVGRLIISDSEVDEMHPDWQGYNVFESLTDGTLSTFCDTLGFSSEPTGVAVNAANGHIFFSDDNANAVFEVDLGPDGDYCTADDAIATLDTTSVGTPSSNDPEGVAYGNNQLFISDGVNAEVYVVDLGGNGVIGGGDDAFTHQFDTSTLGLSYPQGIEYNAASGTLLIVSSIGSDSFLVETTTMGTALNSWDLSSLGSPPRNGLALAPGSQVPSATTLYMASQGIDNSQDPNENDGKVYEIDLDGSGIPAPLPNPIYLSTESSATIGGVSGADEDIFYFDGASWSLHFDGSDVGLSNDDIDAFHIVDGDTILLSFTAAATPDGLTVDDHDIVEFAATSLGDTTAGSFTLYFDGEDVDLTDSGEDIDALLLLDDGTIIMSTLGDPTVTGVADPRDEDLLAFTPTTLGDTTSGTWEMYFDGSDVELGNGPNVDGVSLAANRIYLSTDSQVVLNVAAARQVPGSLLTTEKEDVFSCTPTATGETTVCPYASELYFDGTAWGMALHNVNAIMVPAPLPTSITLNGVGLSPALVSVIVYLTLTLLILTGLALGRRQHLN